MKEQLITGTIDGKELVVNRKAPALLQDVVLHNCTIVLAGNRKNIRFFGMRAERCEFKSHGVEGLDFSLCVRCALVGRFSGCRFGTEGHDLPGLPKHEGLRNTECDFTKARLDGCWFHEPLEGHRFGSWPQVLVLNPAEHKNEIKKIQWPNESQMTMTWVAEQRSDVTCMAVLGDTLPGKSQ